jgi:hypothetical protein
MQRPVAVLCITFLLLFACAADDQPAEPDSVQAATGAEVPGEPESPDGLTLTEEGRDRTVREERALPQIDPRDDAFSRSFSSATVLFPYDYRIGPVGPPRNAFDRQLWEIAHSLLRDPSTAEVSVATFDAETLSQLSSRLDSSGEFRVSPPLSVADGEYSLLFRGTGEESVKGELILVLHQGEWYTAGIQWEPVSDRVAPFAPEQTIPELVW